jgi:hypothetical protein
MSTNVVHQVAAQYQTVFQQFVQKKNALSPGDASCDALATPPSFSIISNPTQVSIKAFPFEYAQISSPVVSKDFFCCSYPWVLVSPAGTTNSMYAVQ